jgi:hypothetical protein
MFALFLVTHSSPFRSSSSFRCPSISLRHSFPSQCCRRGFHPASFGGLFNMDVHKDPASFYEPEPGKSTYKIKVQNRSKNKGNGRIGSKGKPCSHPRSTYLTPQLQLCARRLLPAQPARLERPWFEKQRKGSDKRTLFRKESSACFCFALFWSPISAFLAGCWGSVPGSTWMSKKTLPVSVIQDKERIALEI